jgi:hypothetical protein
MEPEQIIGRIADINEIVSWVELAYICSTDRADVSF